MMITLLPGLRVSERHVNQPSETTKFRNHCKNSGLRGNYLSTLIAEQFSLLAAKWMTYYGHNKQYVTMRQFLLRVDGALNNNFSDPYVVVKVFLRWKVSEFYK